MNTLERIRLAEPPDERGRPRVTTSITTAAITALLRLTLDLPEGRGYVTGLRRTARCLMESVSVGRQDIDDIELMLGELATNAVIHSCAHGYRVELEFYGDRVLVIVTDRGRGFSESSVPPPGTPRHDALDETDPIERFGGWGLPLVYSLADHVDILPTLPHGTTVRAVKLLAIDTEE